MASPHAGPYRTPREDVPQFPRQSPSFIRSTIDNLGMLCITIGYRNNYNVRAVQIARERERMRKHVESSQRSEEHTSELQSLMRISYAVFCLKTKQTKNTNKSNE